MGLIDDEVAFILIYTNRNLCHYAAERELGEAWKMTRGKVLKDSYGERKWRNLNKGVRRDDTVSTKLFTTLEEVLKKRNWEKLKEKLTDGIFTASSLAGTLSC